MYMGGTDTCGFQFKVPALMILISRDQESYDFMNCMSLCLQQKLRIQKY
jgi:hypothetical protein